MTNADIITKLELIRNKGNCVHTMHKARKALVELIGTVQNSDCNAISIALSHHELGEGAAELNDVLAKIKAKYE